MRRHNRQFILLCGALLLCAMRLSAEQTAREAIHENIFLSASNFLAYMPPTEPLTKTPKGYEPFYMTHYGRHGSRWHTNDNTCNDIIKALTAAEEAGKLTATGREVLRKMNQFYPLSAKRLGDLTPLGERQHHGIGRRMTEHFPEIFKGDAYVDARSTVVVRCILSMVAECEELMAFNPKLRIHN
ncbi:MAG: histidine acid phosphatase, partial [Bacteroidales bacterium]|nr:histidine acid phosphatase [Bacteroidales bacterium]